MQPADFSALFKGANPQAIDLMHRMLRFHPNDRISVDAALAHPYLAALHDPNAEPCCPRTILLGFEEDQIDGEQVRERMLHEIEFYYQR